MTKKFLSLVLSVAFVIGLIPMMSVSADTSAVSVLYEEDFTNFDLTSFNENYDSPKNQYTVSDKSGTARFSTGKYLRTDIINMPGYDGANTNVVKVILDPPSKTSITSTEGLARMTFSGLQTALGTVNDGALVYEFKMYIPEADSSGNKKDIATFAMAPFVKNGDNFSVGTGTNDRKVIDSPKPSPGNWYKFTYVLLLNESKVLVYCNDEMVSYKQRTVSDKGYRIQMQAMRDADDEHIIFDDFKIWHIAAVSEVDSSAQCITSAASDFADAEGVSYTAQPTVDFTNPLLVRTVGSDATVSKANVIMTNSDGAVEVGSVEASDDKKSIVIDPAADLVKGMRYNVKVTGLTDMYDQTIPDYEFSFTTAAETNISATKPVFSKMNFEEGTKTKVDAIEEGHIYASYTLTNNSASAKSVVMMAVLKDDDTFENIQLKQETIPAGATVSFNGGFKIENPQTEKMEIYVWDDMSNMTPIVEKYAIDAEGITPSIN